MFTTQPEPFEPPKGRRQKHYTSEREIVTDLHKAQRKQLTTYQKAELQDLLADELAKGGGDPRSYREEAIRLRSEAARIDTRIKRLSATMAAFKTEPLIGERDVVLQNVG